ncbi:MAG: gamma-glutamylcyclotransferase [Alphaproteobacteria bacterium]
MSNARSRPESYTLTREMIAAGRVRELVLQSDQAYPVLSDDELVASRRQTLALAGGEDVWVFGYGSLIWNPAFHFAEKRIGTIHGFHRRFCLWTPIGRGTKEFPGLMLGLERGGSCRGLAYRIEADKVECELDIIWRREMVSGAYAPRWVTMRGDATGGNEGPVRAIAFVINHTHERYAGLLPEARVAAIIAKAEGGLGRCCDYLFNTVEHLDELGIADAPLSRLAAQVAKRL